MSGWGAVLVALVVSVVVGVVGGWGAILLAFVLGAVVGVVVGVSWGTCNNPSMAIRNTLAWAQKEWGKRVMRSGDGSLSPTPEVQYPMDPETVFLQILAFRRTVVVVLCCLAAVAMICATIAYVH